MLKASAESRPDSDYQLNNDADVTISAEGGSGGPQRSSLTVRKKVRRNVEKKESKGERTQSRTEKDHSKTAGTSSPRGKRKGTRRNKSFRDGK